MNKYKEDEGIVKNDLYYKLDYLWHRTFHEPQLCSYYLENVRKESVKSRIETAKEIKIMCENLTKEEIIELLTLGY